MYKDWTEHEGKSRRCPNGLQSIVFLLIKLDFMTSPPFEQHSECVCLDDSRAAFSSSRQVQLQSAAVWQSFVEQKVKMGWLCLSFQLLL